MTDRVLVVRETVPVAVTIEHGHPAVVVVNRGPQGPQGEQGFSLLSGDGPPSPSDGVEGDFWIDRLADTIYGPKIGASWGSPTLLIGPPGDAGPQGPTGPVGPAGITFRGAWDSGTA